MLSLSSADFFSKLTFSKKNYLRNTIRVSNGLDPDQDIMVQTACKGYQQTIKDYLIKFVCNFVIFTD